MVALLPVEEIKYINIVKKEGFANSTTKKKIKVKVKEDETTRNLKENLKTTKNLSTIDIY